MASSTTWLYLDPTQESELLMVEELSLVTSPQCIVFV